MVQDRSQKLGRSSFDDYKEEPLGLLQEKEPEIEELSHSSLTNRQKLLTAILAGLLLVLILVIGFGAESFFSIPVPGGQERVDAENAATEASQVVLDEDDPKAKDTDEDGVSDYDELNVYVTSPYLQDSDSDGLTDKEEIDNGTDPNCPVGKTCFNSFAETESDSATANVQTPTPDQLRQLLLTSGKFSSEQVQQLSDEELLNFYQQISGDESVSTSVDVQAKKSASDYTPNELRVILLENGVPSDVVESLSDEELIEFFKQAWEQANQTVNQ